MSTRRVGVVRSGERACERFADGSWRVTVVGMDDPSYASFLRRYYESWPRWPADGHPGVAELEDLARILQGTVEIDPRPDSPPGMVY